MVVKPAEPGAQIVGEAPVRFVVDGVQVAYSMDSMGGDVASHDHFELHSFSISETGYRSHFVPSSAVIKIGGPEKYARALIDVFWLEPDNQIRLC
jgi:hypothetical protein